MERRKTFLKKYYQTSLLIYVFFFPFSIALSNLTLINLAIATVANWVYLKDFKLSKVYSGKVSLLMSGIFMLELISLFYTDNMKDGFSLIERNSIFLALPFLLYKANPSDLHFKKHLHITFFLSCVIIMLISYFVAFYDVIISAKDELINDIIFNFTYQELASKSHSHALYLTSYLILAFFMGLQLLKEKSLELYKLHIKTILVFFIISIFLLKSAMLIFSFSIIIYFYLINKEKSINIFINLLSPIVVIGCYFVLMLKMRMKIELNYTILISLYIVSFLTSFFISFLIKKYSLKNLMTIGYSLFFILICSVFILIFKDETLSEYIRNNPSNVAYRYWNWKSAMMVISENVLLGVGVGDTVDNLVDNYKQLDFESGIWFRFNEHNQYLRHWLGSGILSFISFFFVIITLIKKSILSKNTPFLVLMITFVMFSVVESTLGRHFGIVFYSFFFLFYDKMKVESNKIK